MKQQLSSTAVAEFAKQTPVSRVRFDTGVTWFNSDWKNRDSGCIRPKSAARVIIRHLNILPQNPTPAPDISHIGPFHKLIHIENESTWSAIFIMQALYEFV